MSEVRPTQELEARAAEAYANGGRSALIGIGIGLCIIGSAVTSQESGFLANTPAEWAVGGVNAALLVVESVLAWDAYEQKRHGDRLSAHAEQALLAANEIPSYPE